MSDNLIPVAEILGPTIQGDGCYVGRPSVFVSTSDCYNPANAHALTQMTAEAIVEDVAARLAPGGVVVLTGGDPCIHNGLGDVVTDLVDAGYVVQVETQGAINADWLDHVDTICLSLKPPSSGVTTDFDKLDAIVALTDGDEVPGMFLKVPVADAADLEFADMLSDLYPDLQLYVQPVNPTPGVEIDTATRLAAFERLVQDVLAKQTRHTWIVSLQLHVRP